MKFNPKALPITSKALFTIVGGAVLINPVFAQEQASEELEEVVVTGLRGSLKASMETKRDAIGVVDAINCRRHRQVPGHQPRGVAAAHHRHLDRSPQRRRRAGNGARLRPAVQHGHAERPPDAGRRRVRRRRRGHRRQRPAVRSFNFANLAAEAISAVEVYKTGRADIATGGIGATINMQDRAAARQRRHGAQPRRQGASTTRPIASATTSLRKCRASSATPTTPRPSASAFRPATRSATAARRSSTVNDWHIRPWNTDAVPRTRAGAAVRQQQQHARIPGDDFIAATSERAGERPALRHPERHPLRVLRFERERINAQVSCSSRPSKALTLTATTLTR